FGSGFHFLGVLLAHAYLAFERVPVTQSAATDLAVADGVYVVLGAIVLHLAVVGLLDYRREGFLVLSGVFRGRIDLVFILILTLRAGVVFRAGRALILPLRRGVGLVFGVRSFVGGRGRIGVRAGAGIGLLLGVRNGDQ